MASADEHVILGIQNPAHMINGRRKPLCLMIITGCHASVDHEPPWTEVSAGLLPPCCWSLAMANECSLGPQNLRAAPIKRKSMQESGRALSCLCKGLATWGFIY